MTRHYFDVEIASRCGVNAAIIYENLKFWILKNRERGVNLRDGRHWVYQTQRELAEQFEYLSAKQVRTAIDRLEADGLILKGNYNRTGYDRTTWYSLASDEALPVSEISEKAENVSVLDTDVSKKSEKAENVSVLCGKHKGRKHLPSRANPEPIWLFGGGKKGATIQDIKTDSEKEKMIQRMRRLAADCGAVCSV